MIRLVCSKRVMCRSLLTSTTSSSSLLTHITIGGWLHLSDAGIVTWLKTMFGFQVFYPMH